MSSADKLEYLLDYYLSVISMWIKSLIEYHLCQYNAVIGKLKKQYTSKNKI